MAVTTSLTRLMRLQTRPGSPVKAHYYYNQTQPRNDWAEAEVIALGISADPSTDLVCHRGRTVRQIEFQNVFLGGRMSRFSSEIDQINTAITLAMRDRRLSNAIRQYFNSGVNLTCDPRPMLMLDEPKPDYP